MRAQVHRSRAPRHRHGVLRNPVNRAHRTPGPECPQSRISTIPYAMALELVWFLALLRSPSATRMVDIAKCPRPTRRQIHYLCVHRYRGTRAYQPMHSHMQLPPPSQPGRCFAEHLRTECHNRQCVSPAAVATQRHLGVPAWHRHMAHQMRRALIVRKASRTGRLRRRLMSRLT